MSTFEHVGFVYFSECENRFLRDDDDKELEELSPEDRIAVKYYRGLFKEFALVDLKHYKSGQVRPHPFPSDLLLTRTQFALRWRTEPEVLSGLGQFTCGNTRCAYHQAEDDMPVPQPKLVTLELPFGYVEEGEAKQALVKVCFVFCIAGSLGFDFGDRLFCVRGVRKS